MSENSGTYMVVGGLIVLVFAGVILSVAMDQRSSFLSANKAVNQDIQHNEDALSALTPRYKRLKQLDEVMAPRLAQAAEMETFEGKLVDQRLQLDSLQAQAAELKSSLAAVNDSFGKYQLTYRKGVWDAAANEKLPELVLRTGRRYEGVTILRVTPAGLEISHSDGNARISPADLDTKWQDRFLWRDNERLEQLKQEQAAAPTIGAQPAPDPGTTSSKSATPDLDSLQVQYNAWNAKITVLRAQRDEAVSRSNGGARSAPGSLETWEARIKRISAELDRAIQYRDRIHSQLNAAGRPQPSTY